MLPSERSAHVWSVLLVDDDLASAAAIQAELQSRWFHVVGVEFAPRRLVKVLPRCRPDLIILNVRDEWPELDFVIFQAACGGAIVLLAGNHSQSFWANARATGIYRLPSVDSPVEIADAAAELTGLYRHVA